MIYTTGTVNVVEGSRTVTGNSTEFIKYVSTGAIFKIQGDLDFYTVVQVLNNTSLILDRNYSGTTKNLQTYSINPDKTPNLNLPLLAKNDPDITKTINIAFNLIDKNTAGLLDFTHLSEITMSGEKYCYIDNDYHATYLEEDRIVGLMNSSGEYVNFNRILSNSLFTGQIQYTPSDTTIQYINPSESTVEPASRDILHNLDSLGYAFIKSTNFGDTSGEIIISGEVMYSDGQWDLNDRIAVYGQTRGLGQISSVSSSGEVLVAVSGETLDSSLFLPGTILYNYNKNNSRAIISVSGSDPVVIVNDPSTDNWAIGDIVYTVRQLVEFEISGVPSTVTDLYYGAKSNTSEDGIKQSHIDWGTGYNQVDASDIPIDTTWYSGETKGALDWLYDELIEHETSGEVHLASNISFNDDLQGAIPLSSTDVNAAINEIKLRMDAGVILEGSISSGESKTSFYCDDFADTPSSFFSGEWWVRFDSGAAEGNARKITSFTPTTGLFTLSGECTYIPTTGSAFTLIGRVINVDEHQDSGTHEQLQVIYSGETVFTVNHSGEIDGLNCNITSGETYNIGGIPHTHDIDASQVISGVFDIGLIPHAALERMVAVADETARFALTSGEVQLGDSVRENDTEKLFIVIDLDNLGNENGYQIYTSYVSWSNVYDTPTTRDGYGITDVPLLVTPSVDNAVVRFNGTSGEQQTSLPTINDDGTLNAYSIIPVADDTYSLGASGEAFASGAVKQLITDHIDFNLGYVNDANLEGKVNWNADDGTLEVGMPGGKVCLQVGQEGLVRVKNETGSTIENGRVVYVSGISSNKPSVALADYENIDKIHILGVATEDIPSTGNKLGYIALWGRVTGDEEQPIDTSSFSEGDKLYLNASGEFTNVFPTDPTKAVVVIGTVLRSNSNVGSILLDISYFTNGQSLNGTLRSSIINNNTGSSSATGFTAINDAGHRMTVGIGGENNSAFPDVTVFYGEGYNDNWYTVDGNKSHKWFTDPTDSHDNSSLDYLRMELDPSGELILHNRLLNSPTYKSVQKFFDLSVSAGRVSGGTITKSGETISVSAGTGFIKTSDSDVAPVYSFDWNASGEISIPSNTTKYVGIIYNGGTPQVTIRDNNSWDLDTEFPLGSVINFGGTLYTNNNPWWISDGITNIIERFQAEGYIKRDDYVGGLILGTSSSNTTRKPTLTAGTVWSRLNEFSITAKDCSLLDVGDTFNVFYRDGSGSWTQGIEYTDIDDYYDDNSGTLQPLDNNKYVNFWVFVEIDDGGKLMIIYPQTQYNTAAEAEAGEIPVFPTEWYEHGILVGRIIIKQGVAAPIEVQSAFKNTFGYALAADHNNLSSLQGGTIDEYYHLTSSDYSLYNTGGVSGEYLRGDKTWQTLNQASVIGLKTTDSPTFAGLIISGSGNIGNSGNYVGSIYASNHYFSANAKLSTAVDAYSDQYISGNCAIRTTKTATSNWGGVSGLIEGSLYFNPSVASVIQMYCFRGQALIIGSNYSATSYIVGMGFNGAINYGVSGGSSNLTVYAGKFTGIYGGGATCTLGTLYSLHVQPVCDLFSLTSSITTAYGLYIQDSNVVTGGTQYLAYIEKPIYGSVANYQLVMAGHGIGSGIWLNGISNYVRIYASLDNIMDLDVNGTTILQLTSTKVESSQDLEIPSDKGYYIGDTATNGSWRTILSGDDLVIEKRESGSWVTKSNLSFDGEITLQFPMVGVLKNTKFAPNRTRISDVIFEKEVGSSGVIRAIQYNWAKSSIDESVFVNSPDDAVINIYYDGEESPSTVLPVTALAGSQFGEYVEGDSYGVFTGTLDSKYFMFKAVTKDDIKNVRGCLNLRYPIPYTNGIKLTVTTPTGYMASFNVEYQDELPQCWNRNLRLRCQYNETELKRNVPFVVDSVSSGYSSWALFSGETHCFVDNDEIYFSGELNSLYPYDYIVSVIDDYSFYIFSGESPITFNDTDTGSARLKRNKGTITVTEGDSTIVGSNGASFTGMEGKTLKFSSFKDVYISNVINDTNIECLNSDVNDPIVWTSGEYTDFSIHDSYDFIDISGEGYLVSTSCFFKPTDYTEMWGIGKTIFWCEASPRIFIDEEEQPSFPYSGVEDFFQIAPFTETPYAAQNSGMPYYDDVEKAVSAFRNFPIPLKFTSNLKGKWSNTFNMDMFLRWFSIYYSVE